MSTEAVHLEGYHNSPAHETAAIIQALTYAENTFTDMTLNTLAGRAEYAMQALTVFTFVQKMEHTNEISGLISDIIAALEGWAEYTAPVPKQKKVDRADRITRSGRR